MTNEIPELAILQNLESLEMDVSHERIWASELQTKINLNCKLLNIIHFNIRSIHRNFNEFLVAFETYNLQNCDIIVFSESFESYDSQYALKGYNMFYNGAKHNRNDGAIIFIKSTLIYEVNHTLLGECDVTVSNVLIKKENLLFNIICLYRPPNTNKVAFLGEIEVYLAHHKRGSVDLFLGDINIDILDKTDHTVNSYLAILNSFGFVSCINAPTREKSCIDHIFLRTNINKNKINFEPFIVNLDLTDHNPVMLSINKVSNCKKNNNSLPTKKTIDTINEQLFNLLIRESDWALVLDCADVVKATDEFYKKINELLKQATCVKKVKYVQFKKCQPWITNGLIRSIKTRDEMKRKLLSNFNENDNQIFKTYRNNLKKVIEKCKYGYYKNKIDSAENDLKKVYKLITDATNNTQDKSNNAPPPILNNDMSAFADLKHLANFCNEFFINIGVEMLNKIPEAKNKFQISSNQLTSMYLRPVNKNEIIEKINSLKNDSSPGIDKISTKLIKDNHLCLLDPLVHIINLIFKSGTVPDQFKMSVITPIYKSDDKTKVTNYRPINLINNFAKIFEKCIKDRLLHFLQSNSILSSNQYGFLSKLSTSNALYHLSKEVTDKLDIGERCIAVFLDLAKAFDTVPHRLLLEVMEKNGVRGAVLDVFESYLHGRVQYVKIVDTLSDPLNIKIGVPQGTVLGPILFLVFINSLTNLKLENAAIISYADDTAIVFSGKSWDEVKQSVIDGLEVIQNWLNSFKLTLNLNKTTYIAFSITLANRPTFNSIQVRNSNTIIKEVSHTRYLGVIIDMHLKWNHHALKLTSTIRKLLYKFYILRNILNKNLLISVYRTIVESLLRYGIVVWGGMYKTALQPLKIVQNYILKIIYKKNRLYPTNMLYSRDIFDIRTLYVLETSIFVYKNKDLKNFISHGYQTRNKANDHIKLPKSNTNTNLRFFNYFAPKIYNIIPLDIRNITKIYTFKKKCRSYIFENINVFRNLF